jgi:hypothetical protein
LFEGRGGEAHTEAQKVSARRRVLEAKRQPVLNSQESPSWSDQDDAVAHGMRNEVVISVESESVCRKKGEKLEKQTKMCLLKRK